MPRLCSGHYGLERIQIAHLPHKDHIGILPHHRLQRGLEIVRVDSHFALVDDRFLILMNELDGIFDCHDMALALLVDRINYRSQRRGLTASRRPRDQAQPPNDVGHFQARHRQVQLLPAQYLRLDAPQHDRNRAPLAEHVRAKPANAFFREREIQLALLREIGLLLAVQQHIDDRVDVLGLDWFAVLQLHDPVDTVVGRLARF